MERILKLILVVLIVSFISTSAIAGITTKINSSTVTDSDLILSGINFEQEMVVAIGGIVLNDCNITSTEIVCPLPQGLTENSSWTVSISAGNSPKKNDEIDVYIPSTSVGECTIGDSFECYPSDMATNGVGECHAGFRTCIDNGFGVGVWADCEGAVIPVEEECGDGLDNDCNGVDDDKDFDGDGYIDDECDGGNDCDDSDLFVNLGIEEVCGDGIDNDCDGIDNECQVQLDMIVLLDRSDSMNANSKWDMALESLILFSNEETPDTVRLGLNFFPPPGISDLCSQNSYIPLHVNLEYIPTNADILEDALVNMQAAGQTPTYYALVGTSMFAQSIQTPTREAIVVLITDGDPSGCDSFYNSIPQIRSAASNLFNYTGIRTYVVTLQGAPVSDFDQVANAGGTDHAIDISSDTALLHQTLIDIRNEATAGL